jgi:hypothetical protein
MHGLQIHGKRGTYLQILFGSPHRTDPLLRYSLNYKGLSYRTEWIEFPDIEAHCKAIGASATSTNIDGSPFYTLPVIKDLSTGAVVSESAAIAKYLDDTYPSTPALFVDSESISQLAFIRAHGDATKELWDFALPRIKLHPVSDAYLRRTKEPERTSHLAHTPFEYKPRPPNESRPFHCIAVICLISQLYFSSDSIIKWYPRDRESGNTAGLSCDDTKWTLYY